MSYIVSREKPKCYNCPFRTLDYCGLLIEHDCVTVNVNEMTISKYCPLIEIPTPHGRLIDADELANKTFYSVTSAPYITYKKFVDAPTVIEAEGSKE